MKTLTILFMLIAGVSFAQVRESNPVEEGVIIGISNASGLPVLKKYDNQYIITYINEKYREINDIETVSFTANNEDVERLYSLFKDQVSKTSKTEIELGEDYVYLSFEKGRLIVTILHEEGNSSYFYLQPNEIEKLFGKV